MADAGANRTDSPLIKHLAQTMGLKAAEVYNGLPLFVMPEEANELTEREEDLLDAAPEQLPLPFEDFLLDFPFGTAGLLSGLPNNGDKNRGRLWVRVRRVSSVHADPATQIGLSHLTSLPDPQSWILLEGWEERTVTGGLSISPIIPSYPCVNQSLAIFLPIATHIPTANVGTIAYGGFGAT